MMDTKIMAQKIKIFNVQKYNIYDGPGVRTLIFFHGCPLRCQWCSNPESREQKYQLMFKQDNCQHCGACVQACPAGVHRMEQGRHILDRSKGCGGCGRCVAACPQEALSLLGQEKTVAELMDVINEDRIFYGFSNGGVTLSGGEVLMQPEGAAALLQACRQQQVHTAIETSGYAPAEVLAKIAPYVDLFLFDIKHMNEQEHKRLTGVSNVPILSNLHWLLANGYPVKVRLPLLKGVNDQLEEMAQIIAFLQPFQGKENFLGIDLLPYHKMGVNKYKQLGKEYQVPGDPSMMEADLQQIADWFSKFDLAVKIIRH